MDFDFEIPGIAQGTVIPYGVQKVIDDRERLEEEKQKAEERERKAQRRADLYFVIGICANVVCTIVGWILGKYF